jgi:hypothetical protein
MKIKGEKVIFQEPDINNENTAICFFPEVEDLKLVARLPLALKKYGHDLVLQGV